MVRKFLVQLQAAIRNRVVTNILACETVSKHYDAVCGSVAVVSIDHARHSLFHIKIKSEKCGERFAESVKKSNDE